MYENIAADRHTVRTRGKLLLCFSIAVIIITICSQSSPLYPFNEWVDVHCFFTVGKSIRSGIVPYRDLFEQKGPFLYFLFALTSMVSYKTFLGVYFLEILCGTVFLYYSLKILELYCEGRAMYCLPFLAVAVFTCRAFVHGGSAEEFCFPMLTASLYLFLKAAKQQSGPSNWESFCIGLLSVCIFWTKFTLVGIYVGWFLVFACEMLYRRKARQLGRTVVYILAGLAAGTLPYVLYFGYHHAIRDWLEVYLYDNLFLYSPIQTDSNPYIDMAKKVYYGLWHLHYIDAVLPLIGIGALSFFIHRRALEGLYVLSMLAGTLVFCYIGGRYSRYYSLSVVPFVCLGFIPVCLLFSKIKKSPGTTRLLYSGYALLVAAAVFLTPNRYLMLVDKSVLPQYEFARQITETPDATLLNYDFLDGGFYTTTGIVPNCRAFCKLNISLEELTRLQKDTVENGLCDYVVTNNEELTQADPNGLYALVDTKTYDLEGDFRTYYLYRLKSLGEETA